MLFTERAGLREILHRTPGDFNLKGLKGILSLPLLAAAMVLSARFPAGGASNSREYARARVLEVVSETRADDVWQQSLLVKVLRGSYRGTVIRAGNRTWGGAYGFRAAAGDTLIVSIDTRSAIPSAQVAARHRSPYALLALGLFILVFMLVSGVKSAGALSCVGINAGLVVFLLIPLLIRGWAPLPAALAVCILGIAFSVRVILGGGPRFLASSAGAACGVLFAAALTVFFSRAANLTGLFAGGSSRLLSAAARHLPGWALSDMNGLLAAGFMVAALGAVVDVSVTITSACSSFSSEGAGRNRLWRSGLQVGRDITATMLNSLILVFLSLSFPVIGLFSVMDIPFVMAFNFEFFVVMAAGALITSSAMVAAVPASAFISSRLLAGK